MLKKFRVKVLTHRQIAGIALDGHDAVYSKGMERSVVISFGANKPSERIAMILATRKLPKGVFATRIL